MRRIIYLYREINPYNLPVFKELVRLNFKVFVVHQTSKKLIPYNPPNIDNITFIPKEDLTLATLNDLISQISPSIIYVSDRTIAMYNAAAVLARTRLGIPVISGCDTQWFGGKQWINVFTSWFRHKVFFSHIIVAGMRQYEYAKRLGFSNERILWPMNSADIETFGKCHISLEKFTKKRNFLYVGRFAEEKGISVLLKAWDQIAFKNGATLTLIGAGPSIKRHNISNDVTVLDFMSQSELKDIAEQSSCFILPSLYEPWALVIHEFAAAGLPLIVTDACGATSHFVIRDYNGYVVRKGSVEDLKKAIETVINMPAITLEQFSYRSRTLSQAINPAMVAYAIASVLD